MNKVIVSGRLTKNPEIYHSNKNTNSIVAKYTLAVNNYLQHKGKTSFLTCVTFGKSAEFAERYLRKGIKIEVTGRLQTGSYVNQEGRTIYTTDIIVESQEFSESKSTVVNHNKTTSSIPTDENDFMNIPDGVIDELPF